MSPDEFAHLRRVKLNLSQKELAKALCVPRVHVERLEKSRHPIPGQTARLMEAFEAGFRPYGAWPEKKQVWSG